jgi:NhaP-type Na+/H+ or K+/H+ antiporter
MTSYLLIIFCLMVLMAYIFDITAKSTRIPGVILLILSGMVMNYLASVFGIRIPNLSVLLPLMGTLGLILIVLESSMELSISADKRRLILSATGSAFLLLTVFTGVVTWILVYHFQLDMKSSLISILPLAIIGSTVAISAAVHLSETDREFIAYESSLSCIFGILIFDFILLGKGAIGTGIAVFAGELFITIIGAVVISTGLAIVLHKITHQVKYIVIMTVIVLVYAVAKLIHLPSLLVILIFGLVMNNTHFFKTEWSEKIVNFRDFAMELISFRGITGELSFVVRSFFFILFGYYTNLSDLMNLTYLSLSALIVLCILLIRGLFLLALRQPLIPLLFFAPRGLITILLFLSIPDHLMLPFMNEGVVTQVIFLSILVMMLGNIFFGKRHLQTQNGSSQGT